jgi:hypothetical protein
MFFFEKKNQKTFISCCNPHRALAMRGRTADGYREVTRIAQARCGLRVQVPRNKSLLLLFFRKEGLSSFA